MGDASTLIPFLKDFASYMDQILTIAKLCVHQFTRLRSIGFKCYSVISRDFAGSLRLESSGYYSASSHTDKYASVLDRESDWRKEAGALQVPDVENMNRVTKKMTQ